MFIRTLCLMILVGISLALTPSAGAGVILSLDDANIAGSSASFGVSLSFTGTPGDTVEAIQLSIGGSSASLTAGGTDFTRFSFSPNNALFSAWSAFPANIGESGFSLLLPNDVINGPFLTPDATPYYLGELLVDLSNLAGNVPLNVTLANADPAFPSGAFGTVDGDFVDLNAQFAQPDGITFNAPDVSPVPEPSSLAIFSVLAVSAGLAYRRKCRLEKQAKG